MDERVRISLGESRENVTKKSLAVTAVLAAAVWSMEVPAAEGEGDDPWAECAARAIGVNNPSVSYINPETLFEAKTYSVAARLPANAEVVHISGQIPIGRDYAVQGDDLVTQLEAVLNNLCHALEAAGVTTADVYRLGVSYVHAQTADPFVLSETLAEFFYRAEMPVTTMTAVPFLITDGVRVQIDASAVAPPAPKSAGLND